MRGRLKRIECLNAAQCTSLVHLFLVLTSCSAQTTDIETRDFLVQVSGKVCGEVHMTIHRQSPTQISVRCDTDLKVALPTGNYRYSFRGMEVWRDRQFVRLDSHTDDNGRRYVVTAIAEPTGVRVKVNNRERIVAPVSWLTTYWSLPEPNLRKQSLHLLDADNGNELYGRLEFVANEKLTIAGQQVALNHYRVVMGKNHMDLWYDGTERLVRQEWVELGHRTVIELIRIRR